MKLTTKSALLIILTGAIGFAGNNKLSPELQNFPPDRQIDVIVHYRVQPQARHYARMAQMGGRLRRTLEVVSSAAYTTPAARLQEMANDPDVDYISPDRPVQGLLDYAEPATTADIALRYGWDGTGVTVAVIDSGIMDTHPDLQDSSGNSRVVYAQTFVNSGKDDRDEYGHGTHVSGIIGGNATMSTGPAYTHTFLGIAPKVKYVSLKVLDRNGAGTDSMVIAAIQQAIALKSTYNVRIINLSLGRPVIESYTLDPLCQAVEQAWKAGIVVVVAAGNDGRNNSAGTNGYGTINSPGNDPYVITVGAMKDMKTLTRSDDLMASYSSKGPTRFDRIVKPDLVAPGNLIMSAMPANGLYLPEAYPANRVPDTYYTVNGDLQGSAYYFTLSGTSMAAPMVSGSAALLLQKTPGLTPDQVKAKLMKSATKTFPLYSTAADPMTGITYTTQYDIFTVGAGYLDTWAALNNTDTISSDKTAVSPVARYSHSNRSIAVMTGASAVWGDADLGLSAVFGMQTLLANCVVRGDSSVWGDAPIADFGVERADSVVWGDATPRGDVDAIAIYGEN